jgi:hypothetical protein
VLFFIVLAVRETLRRIRPGRRGAEVTA